MKASKLVTKIVVRVFFVLLFFALVPFFFGDQSKYHNIYFAFPQKWQMIFPTIIITAFLFLLVSCAIKRYNNPELNWLLILNTVVLTAYGVAIFLKIAHLAQG